MVLLLWLTLGLQAGEITNRVNIASNIDFYLVSVSSPPGPVSQIRSDAVLDFMLLGTSTNYICYRHFPAGNCVFNLYDESGGKVPKTQIGLQAGGTPRKPTRSETVSRKFVPYFVDNQGGECRRLFSADQAFVIPTKGVYELEMQINLCVIMTNGMPDLTAMKNWQNITTHGFGKDFGILTSPPLRIKVIKE